MRINDRGAGSRGVTGWRRFGVILASLLLVHGAWAETRDPAAVRRIYDDIHEHLDPGGDLMIIANVEGLLERMLEQVASFVELIPAEAGMQTETLRARLDGIHAFLETQGFMAAQGIGISLVPRVDGLSDAKMLLAREPQAARLPLWRALIGTAPSRMAGHAYLPRDTVMVRSGTGELDALWALIRRGVQDIGGPDAVTAFNQSLAMAAAGLGVSVDELIQSIGSEAVLALQLSDAETVELAGNPSIRIPAPSLLLVVAVENDLLIETVKRIAADNGMSLAQKDMGQTAVYSLPMPLPLPVPVQLTLATHEGYLLIGSTPAVVEAAIDAAGNGNGLTASDEFLAAYPELGVNNGIHFISRRLADHLAAVYQQLESYRESPAADRAAPDIRPLQMWLEQNLDMYTAMAFYNRRAGIHAVGVSSSDGRDTIGAILAAPAGILAGIAIPSFMQARTRAQAAACMNNIRMIESAKEQFAMANGLGDGDQVAPEAVGEYIRGGFPQCPAGGEYIVNPVGVSARCTVHPNAAMPRP